MIPVYSAQRVRALDTAVIEQVGVPGRQLMELAGRDAAQAIHTRWPAARVGVFCGPGNNGGDGYVVARWLHLWGHEVRIWAPRRPTSADARANQALCVAMGLSAGAAPAPGELDVVVDALLGTGQRKAPRGAIAEGVAMVRELGQAGAAVVALDLPTGVCADTGQALGEPVQASLTVTFGMWKPGLLCAPGALLCGEVLVVDIGLALAALAEPTHETPDAWLLTQADVQAWLPRPSTDRAKWDRGHVAVRAGGGAGVLAALGAFAAGAGLVTLLAPRAEWPALHGLDPSVILAEPDAFHPRRHDALVLGPGLGVERAAEVRRIWAECPTPVLADADALTILAQDPVEVSVAAHRVITPHSAEAGRLLGQRRQRVEADRFAAVRALGPLGMPVLKGPHTLIGDRTPWVSPVADDRLAVAGSGDVLAGVIGSGLARGLDPKPACALGVWVHAAAAAHQPTHGTARHLLDGVRAAFAALQAGLSERAPTAGARTAGKF